MHRQLAVRCGWTLVSHPSGIYEFVPDYARAMIRVTLSDMVHAVVIMMMIQ